MMMLTLTTRIFSDQMGTIDSSYFLGSLSAQRMQTYTRRAQPTGKARKEEMREREREREKEEKGKNERTYTHNHEKYTHQSRGGGQGMYSAQRKAQFIINNTI